MSKKANHQPSSGVDACWKQIDAGGNSQKTSLLLTTKNAVLEVLSINNEKYNFVNFADLESDKTKVVISQTIDEVLEVLESLGELNLEDGVKYFNLGVILFKLSRWENAKKYLSLALEKNLPQYLHPITNTYLLDCKNKLLLV